MEKNALNEGKKIGGYVNDLLVEVLKKDTLSIMMSYYSLIDIQNNIFIKDEKIKKIAETYLKDLTLFCSLNQAQDCEHTHFANTILEVAKLNIPSKDLDNDKDIESDSKRVRKLTNNPSHKLTYFSSQN